MRKIFLVPKPTSTATLKRAVGRSYCYCYCYYYYCYSGNEHVLTASLMFNPNIYPLHYSFSWIISCEKRNFSIQTVVSSPFVCLRSFTASQFSIYRKYLHRDSNPIHLSGLQLLSLQSPCRHKHCWSYPRSSTVISSQDIEISAPGLERRSLFQVVAIAPLISYGNKTALIPAPFVHRV
jgi:hypothetical protein